MQLQHVDEVTVFTDGSLMRRKDKQGKEVLYCGYGVYFPNGEISNISRPFSRGRKTNQRAELFAIYVALLVVRKNLTYDGIKIYTDSEYSIKALTKWVFDWEKNGWRTSLNKPVENLDIIKPIHSVLGPQRDKVVFIHVRSHTGAQDAISISNGIVDRLAKDGAFRVRSSLKT